MSNLFKYRFIRIFQITAAFTKTGLFQSALACFASAENVGLSPGHRNMTWVSSNMFVIHNQDGSSPRGESPAKALLFS